MVSWFKSFKFGLKRIFHIIGTCTAYYIFITCVRLCFFGFVISYHFLSELFWLGVIWPDLFMRLVLNSEPSFERLSCSLAQHWRVFILCKKLAGRYKFRSFGRKWQWQLNVNRRCEFRLSRCKVLNAYIFIFLHRSLLLGHLIYFRWDILFARIIKIDQINFRSFCFVCY